MLPFCASSETTTTPEAEGTENTTVLPNPGVVVPAFSCGLAEPGALLHTPPPPSCLHLRTPPPVVTDSDELPRSLAPLLPCSTLDRQPSALHFPPFAVAITGPHHLPHYRPVNPPPHCPPSAFLLSLSLQHCARPATRVQRGDCIQSLLHSRLDSLPIGGPFALPSPLPSFSPAHSPIFDKTSALFARHAHTFSNSFGVQARYKRTILRAK